jgi:hypothetical protein
MTWRKAASSSATRMNVRVAELRVVRRRAVNSAAGKHRSNCLKTAHDEIISLRGFPAAPCESRQIKKSCTSGLFWGLASHNMASSIFGRTTLAIHRYSRFRR